MTSSVMLITSVKALTLKAVTSGELEVRISACEFEEVTIQPLLIMTLAGVSCVREMHSPVCPHTPRQVQEDMETAPCVCLSTGTFLLPKSRGLKRLMVSGSHVTRAPHRGMGSLPNSQSICLSYRELPRAQGSPNQQAAGPGPLSLFQGQRQDLSRPEVLPHKYRIVKQAEPRKSTSVAF